MKKGKINVELEYRLYNSLHSSFFDLIKGNDEVQQTKGLALILASHQKVLYNFLNIPAIKDKTNFNFDKAIINSELISDTDKKKRADIVIRLYRNNIPVQAFVIEARSINKSHSTRQVVEQINEYINNKLFSALNPFKSNVIGVVLTKYNTILPKGSNLVCFTWSDVINFLECSREINKITNDYYYYLTKIKGSMKYYEEEVLSIPTNEASNTLANEYPHIYECPNRGRYIVKSKPLYLTFRKSGGGVMEKLFGIDEIIILNPNKDLADFLNDDNYSEDVRNRIKEYCERIKLDADEEKQFFVLSPNNIINLPHKPKPQKNNSYRKYYTLASLINNTK